MLEKRVNTTESKINVEILLYTLFTNAVIWKNVQKDYKILAHFPSKIFSRIFDKVLQSVPKHGGTRCLLSTFHILWGIAAAIFLAKKAKRGNKTGSTHSGFKLITNFPKPRCRNTQMQKVHQLKNWNGCHLIGYCFARNKKV